MEKWKKKRRHSVALIVFAVVFVIMGIFSVRQQAYAGCSGNTSTCSNCGGIGNTMSSSGVSGTIDGKNYNVLFTYIGCSTCGGSGTKKIYGYSSGGTTYDTVYTSGSFTKGSGKVNGDHSWTVKKYTQTATCTTQGIWYYYCAYCDQKGATKHTENALGHITPNAWTYDTAETTRYKNCSRSGCGIRLSTEYHLTVSKGTGIASVSGTAWIASGETGTIKATVNTGYHWVNWTGSSTLTAQENTITMNGPKSYVANAAVNTGTVYYYPNGGVGTDNYPLASNGGYSASTTTYKYTDTTLNLFDVTTLFARPGYHIADGSKAWRVGSATATTYLSQSSTNMSSYATTHGSTVKLYANWTVNTYSVAYDGNGSTSGSMSNSSHTYDSAKNLTANEYIRDGYTFEGWNTKADGSGTSYKDKESVENLTTTQGGIVTLYAQWSINILNIKYNVNGASVGSSYTNTDNGTIQSNGSDYIQSWNYNNTKTSGLLNDSDFGMSKTGYVFIGWSLEKDNPYTLYDPDDASFVPTDIAPELKYTSVVTKELYAQWKYTIAFNGNGATGLRSDANVSNINASQKTMKDQIVYHYDEPIMLNKNCYEMILENDEEDVIFLGWNTKADGTGTWYKDGQSVTGIANVDGNITLYAQWAVYETNDGKAYITEDNIMHFTGACSGFQFSKKEDVPWKNKPTPWAESGFDTTVVAIDFNNETVNPVSMDYWFYGFHRLEGIPNMNSCISTVSMKSTFEDCRLLKEGVDLTKCKSLKDITRMYANCVSMTIPSEFWKGDSNGNTVLTTLSYAYSGCVNLLYASDMAMLTGILNTKSMFEDCRNISSRLVINANGFSDNSNMFLGAAFTTTPLMLTSELNKEEHLPNGIYTSQTLVMLKKLADTKTDGKSNVDIFQLMNIEAFAIQPKYPVSTEETIETLTVADFQFYARYSDESQEAIYLTADDVVISPNTVPKESGEFMVSLSIKENSPYCDYGGDNSNTDMQVTLAAVELEEKIELEEPVETLIEKEVYVDDPLIKVGYQVFKTDEKDNILADAVFELKALVDIYNYKGEIIVSAGTIIQQQTTGSDGGSVSFSGLPSNKYTANGKNTKAMYEIREIEAPIGYEMDTNATFTFSGEVVDDGLLAEEYIIAKTDDPFINKTNDTFPIQKVWLDGNNIDGTRPTTITIYVKNRITGEITTVTGTGDVNDTTWVIDTGLPRYDVSTGLEIPYQITEQQVSGYYPPTYGRDANGIWTIYNRPTNIPGKKISVIKDWKDTINGIENADRIRPDDGVIIALLADGVEVDRHELTVAMGWKYTFEGSDLDGDGIVDGYPLMDNYGNYIDYTVKELLYDGSVDCNVDATITGDKETGYEPKYDLVENDEDSMTWSVTNYHVGTKTIVLGKRIKADDIHWANGQPIFFFEVNGVLEESKKEVRYVRQVTFTKAYVDSNTDADGYVTLGTTFTGLRAGTYTATEQEVLRYKIESITDVQNGLSNGIISQDSVTFELVGNVRYGTAIFTNTKYEWQDYTHNSMVVNSIGNTNEMAVPYYGNVGRENVLLLLLTKTQDTIYTFSDFAMNGSNLPYSIEITYGNTTITLEDGVASHGCLYKDGVLTLSDIMAKQIANSWKTAISW